MFVYILQSINCPTEFYIGKSRNIRKRLEDHNVGNNISTAGNRPWKVVWYCCFGDKELAGKFEKYLKVVLESISSKRLV